MLHPGARDDYDRKAREDKLGPGARPENDATQGKGSAALGYSRIREHPLVMLYTQYGFTPLEAITVATLEGARALHIDSRTGSVVVGKEADVVVVRVIRQNGSRIYTIFNSCSPTGFHTTRRSFSRR